MRAGLRVKLLRGLWAPIQDRPQCRRRRDTVRPFHARVGPSQRPVDNCYLAFYLPPMPSMNMPEMRNNLQLTSAGNGLYKGSGTVGMAGDWDVTITAARRGQTLGTKKIKLTAK